MKSMKTKKEELTLDNTAENLKSISNDFEYANEYCDHHWSLVENLSTREENRINETISLIPEDCDSILDVGCGDGRIINCLISKYDLIVGLERSQEALRNIKTQKVNGSIDSIPFPDKSFDLVICCEVLEHLPLKVYSKAIKEIERVAIKYIIITVPNNENIKRDFITCPYCSCAFSPWRHFQSFDRKRMRGLFNSFNLKTLKSCGLSKEFPGFLIKIAKLFGVIHNNFLPNSLCPQCGYTPGPACEINLNLNSEIKKSYLIQFIRPLAKWLIPTSNTGGWLMSLYQKEQKSHKAYITNGLQIYSRAPKVHY